MNKKVNLLVIGGSGHLCELNHYPAVRSLNKEGIEARVVAICDPNDPRSADESHYKVGRENLNTILASDDPLWIDPTKFNETDLRNYLNEVAKEKQVDIAIIATNPTFHYFYADWAVDAGISVLCDKPLVAVPDSSYKPEKAQLIEERFQSLYSKVEKAQELNPNFRFCTPLRRRALSPFITIAENLKAIHEKTNQGITHMNIVINGGVHRYPIEYLKGGAHGYIDGIGSLSHSSYHYLDVIAWYLQSAPGNITKIGVTVPHVSRVSDYLARHGYSQLMELNQEEPTIVDPDSLELSEAILNAELDFTLHLHLYDDSDKKIGHISYNSNHTTFSPRTTKYIPDMLDHTNDKDGGRMSQIYFDIHQGSVQNWLLAKNDVVFEGDTIEVTQRLHPALGQSRSHKTYADAYDTETVTLKDLFISFVKRTIGIEVPEKHDEHLQLLSGQKLTHRLFSASYELIAQNYASPRGSAEIIIDLKKMYRHY